MNPAAGDSNPFDAFGTVNGGVASAPPQEAIQGTPQTHSPMMQQQQPPMMQQQQQQPPMMMQQQPPMMQQQQPPMVQQQQPPMVQQQQPPMVQQQQPPMMQQQPLPQQPPMMQQQQQQAWAQQPPQQTPMMQQQQTPMMQQQEQQTPMMQPPQQQPMMQPFQQQMFQSDQEQQQNGPKLPGEEGGLNSAQSQPHFSQQTAQVAEKKTSDANPFDIIVVSPEQQHQMIQQQQQPAAVQPTDSLGGPQLAQQAPPPFGQPAQQQDGHVQQQQHHHQMQQPPFAAPPMPNESGQADANPFLSMAIQPAAPSAPNQWAIPTQPPPQEQPSHNQQFHQQASDQDPFGGVFGPGAGTQPASSQEQNVPGQSPFDPSPQVPSAPAPGALVVAGPAPPGQPLPGYELGLPGSGQVEPPQQQPPPHGNPFGAQQQPSSDPFHQQQQPQPAADPFGAPPQGQPQPATTQPAVAPGDDPFGLFGAPTPPQPQPQVDQQQQPPPPPQPQPPLQQEHQPQEHLQPQQQYHPDGNPPPPPGAPVGPAGNDPNVMQAPGAIARTYSQNLARTAPSASAPLPDPDQVRSTGFIQSRISFRTILLKKWKQCYWTAYGPTVVYVFRSKEDGNDWLYNPYLTKSQREFLVKLRVDFQGDPANTKSIRGYRVTQMKRKGYGKQVLFNFKLERWMDYGPTIAAAFGSPDQKEAEGLRNILVECIRNSPQDPAIAAGAAASGGQVSVHGPAVPQPGQQALDEHAMQQFRLGGAGAEASARRSAPSQGGLAGAGRSSYTIPSGDDDTVAPYAHVNQRNGRGIAPSSAASVSALDDDASIGGVSGVVSHVGDFSYARSGGFARGTASVAAIEDVLTRNPAPHHQQSPMNQQHQPQPPPPQQPAEFQGFYGGNPGISGVPPAAPPTPGHLAPISQGQPFAQQQQHAAGQFQQQQFQQQQQPGYPPNAAPQQQQQFYRPY